jgi:superfamily I DNA and/or RNA helicase
MEINKNEIEKVLKELEKSEILTGRYGNGQKAEYKRIIKNGIEFTYVIEEESKLYIGREGDTVTRIKEGRREDGLAINGEKARFAKLVLKVKNGDFFWCKTEPITI